MWRWYVAFACRHDTRDRRIVGRKKWDQKWKAETELSARLHNPKPDIPGLPEDALIYEFGVECVQE